MTNVERSANDIPPEATDPSRSGLWRVRSLGTRHGALWVFLAAFLGVALLTRVALLAASARELSWDATLLRSFAWGFAFDLGCALLAALPLAFLLAALPAGTFERRPARYLARLGFLAFFYVLLFGAVAEWTFWQEFGSRFNFIAVDYLVYTTEVIGNIRESYPLPLILGALVPGALLIDWSFRRAGWMKAWLSAPAEPARVRWGIAVGWTVVALTLTAGLGEERLSSFGNVYNRELAKNGLWSLVAAFRNNTLDYDRFYATLPVEAAFARLRSELVEDSSILLPSTDEETLRYVRGSGHELRPNVIQITVESLSAKFLGTFDPGSTLTPELDALAAKSLLFDNFYATGTRTDRGMEALTLSLPPTPGRSIVKRPKNAGLFTLGSVFRSKGYDTAFLYGGYGYFDNMNAFFGGNGYRVVDRSSVAEEDVTFANVWGACDEDLYRWTLREADAAHDSGRPFHFFVMTTSNHRPFTYPAGRVDLPSKASGRPGAVKYTDYAIGRFLREASARPWFRDTIFVVVADHCAASAGRTEIQVENYHVPLMIYAPGGQVAPGRISTLTSQVDFAPTLLGLLGWSYPSRFFGHDVRRIEGDAAHALMGTYQLLAHLEKGSLAVLAPRGRQAFFRFDLDSGEQERAPRDEYAELETIAFYQCASHLYGRGGYTELTPEQVGQCSVLGEQLALARSVDSGALR